MKARLMVVAMVVILATPLGCFGGKGSLGSLAKTLSSEICEALDDCGYLAAEQMETCKEVAKLSFQDLQDSFQKSVDTGLFTYNSGNMSKCIDSHIDGICMFGYNPDHRFCDAVLFSVAQVGEPCIEDSCVEEAYCDSSDDEEQAECKTLKAEDAKCKWNSQCDWREKDLRCKMDPEDDTGNCAPIHVLERGDELKTNVDSCGEDLVAVTEIEGDEMIVQCETPLAANEDCGEYGSQCDKGLECVLEEEATEGQCKPLSDVGESCRHAECKAGAHCIDDKCKAEGGVLDTCDYNDEEVPRCFHIGHVGGYWMGGLTCDNEQCVFGGGEYDYQ